jgi:hypothetical protein
MTRKGEPTLTMCAVVVSQIGWWGDMGGPKQKGVVTYGSLRIKVVGDSIGC